jgi:hypothetical protein
LGQAGHTKNGSQTGITLFQHAFPADHGDHRFPADRHDRRCSRNNAGVKSRNGVTGVGEHGSVAIVLIILAIGVIMSSRMTEKTIFP